MTDRLRSLVHLLVNKNIPYGELCQKYYYHSVSVSTEKAIEANWSPFLGFDHKIIVQNIYKGDQSLGISLYSTKTNLESTSYVRHFIRAIMPGYCIANTNIFQVDDEVLEVNGLKVQGLQRNELIRLLKKLPSYFQLVVARKTRKLIHLDDFEANDIIDSEEIDQIDIDDNLSKCSTLKSVSSNFSTTSRDFGLSVSIDDLEQGKHSVKDFLKNIDGWRGPITIEFRKKHREPLGLALEQIADPRNNSPIIVFKTIVQNMKADQDGRLHIGDRILQINGRSVDRVNYSKICQWIKWAPRGRLILQLCKPHFKPIGIDNLMVDSDEMYRHNIGRYSTLPNLKEETDIDNDDNIEVPPAPENLERHIKIKRQQQQQSNDDIPQQSTMNKKQQLGISFGIKDNGKHGCIITQMLDGLALKDGRLEIDDYITNINGVNFRIATRKELNVAIRQVVANNDSHYEISFIKSDDIRIHKEKYLKVARKRRISFRNPMASGHTSENGDFNEREYEYYTLAIPVSVDSKFGIHIGPSLADPDRYVSIVHIEPDSAASKYPKIRINDDIIEVNGKSFVDISVEKATELLKSYISNQEFLEIKFRHLKTIDDSNNMDLVNHFPEIEELPDMYFCTIERSQVGFGFSVIPLEPGLGVIVNTVEDDTPAKNIIGFQPGDRFVSVNNVYTWDKDKSTLVKIVQSTKDYLCLLMEREKYIEFEVEITRHNPKESLGLSIGGGSDCGIALPIIQSIHENHTSLFNLPILPHDLLIQINGINLIGVTHNKAIEIIRNDIPPSPCTIKVLLRRLLPWQPHPETSSILKEPKIHKISLKRCSNNPAASLLDGYFLCDIVIVNNSRSQDQVLYRFKGLSIDPSHEGMKQIKPDIFHNSSTVFLISIHGVKIDHSAGFTNEFLREQIEGCNNDINEVILEVCLDIPYCLIMQNQSKEEVNDTLIQISDEVHSNQENVEKDHDNEELVNSVESNSSKEPNNQSSSSEESKIDTEDENGTSLPPPAYSNGQIDDTEDDKEIPPPIEEIEKESENHENDEKENNNIHEESDEPPSPKERQKRPESIIEPNDSNPEPTTDVTEPSPIIDEEDEPDLSVIEVIITEEAEPDWSTLRLSGGKSTIKGRKVNLPIYAQCNYMNNEIKKGDQILAIDGETISPNQHTLQDIRNLIGQPNNERNCVKITLVRFE